MYSPRKVNILANALSKSKRVEPDAGISMMIEGDQAEGISVMTRSAIVATKEVNVSRAIRGRPNSPRYNLGNGTVASEECVCSNPQGLLVQEEEDQ